MVVGVGSLSSLEEWIVVRARITVGQSKEIILSFAEFEMLETTHATSSPATLRTPWPFYNTFDPRFVPTSSTVCKQRSALDVIGLQSYNLLSFSVYLRETMLRVP